MTVGNGTLRDISEDPTEPNAVRILAIEQTVERMSDDHRATLKEAIAVRGEVRSIAEAQREASSEMHKLAESNRDATASNREVTLVVQTQLVAIGKQTASTDDLKKVVADAVTAMNARGMPPWQTRSVTAALVAIAAVEVGAKLGWW